MKDKLLPNPVASEIMFIRRVCGRGVRCVGCIDELFILLSLVVGVWFLIPALAAHRYPHIVDALSGLLPIRVWGVLFLLEAVLGAYGVTQHRMSALVTAHLWGCGLWLYVGSVMAFREKPPLEGLFLLVIGVYMFRRLAQLPPK